MIQNRSECEEREYWDKRFDLASWAFLGVALFLLFFTDSSNAGLLAVLFSLFFRAVNMYQEIQHVKWHINGNGRH